jgi:hypothetical protein
MAPDEDRLVPRELSVAEIDWADAIVNLNHTSSSAVPVAHPTGMPVLADIFLTVPVALSKPIVNAVASTHSSLVIGAPAKHLVLVNKESKQNKAVKRESLDMVLKDLDIVESGKIKVQDLAGK